MASLSELYDLQSDSALRNKIASAIAIQADAIRTESSATTNHGNRLTWAKKSFANPTGMANDMIWAILAANKTLTVAQIQGASDAGIQTAVANAVDIFATG